MSLAQEVGSCPPQINLPEFHFSCSSASDCAVAGDDCRSCSNPLVINKKFIKEFNERDQLLRQKYECSVTCEACNTKDLKIYCAQNKCTLQAPPEQVAVKKSKKKPAELKDSDDSAALEKDDIY